METKQHSYISGRNARAFTGFDAKEFASLSKLGIDIGKAYGMDALQAGLTVPGMVTPVQNLQTWLPGFVGIMTAPRKIDEITGITTAGEWHFEEVVQGVLEGSAVAVAYGDYQNIPLSSINANFERRTIVRFEQGMQISKLEEAVAGEINLSTADQKRKSAALALEISRNLIGFNGYNAGNNRTYGLLNDPSLGAYVTLPNGAAAQSKWSSKTFLEQTGDIILMVATLQAQTKGLYDPETTEATLVIPVAVSQYLSVTTNLGYSVRKWLSDTYPKIRIVTAPQFDLAVGGLNAAYLFAEKFSDDASTDDGNTFAQIVPMKFKVLGSEQRAKSYVEDYTNATAGVICKRPMAVVRFTGL